MRYDAEDLLILAQGQLGIDEPEIIKDMPDHDPDDLILDHDHISSK